MICLGDQGVQLQRWDAQAAQQRVYELFRDDFLKRFPTGDVISELGFMDRTTKAPEHPGLRQYPGRPRLNSIMKALTDDFRKWDKDGDYRKCDILGIAGDGSVAELIEVTTAKNEMKNKSASTQLNAKLTTLRQTVERIHDLRVEWRASRWRPTGRQMFYLLPQSKLGEVRFLCYTPTYRLMPPEQGKQGPASLSSPGADATVN